MTWDRELMLAYGHIADVLGNPDLNNLGDRPGALAAFRQAAAVGRRLYEALSLRSTCGHRLWHRAQSRRDGDGRQRPAGEAGGPARIAARAGRGGTRQPRERLAPYRALVHLHLGETLTVAGQGDEAKRSFLDSLAIAEPFMKRGHTALVVLFIRANQRLALNAVARGQRAEALSYAERIGQLSEKPPTEVPSVRLIPRVRSATGLTYAALAGSRVQQASDRKDAVAWLRQALDAWKTAAGDRICGATSARDGRSRSDAGPAEGR
jgi:hypothetical protein